PHAAFRLRHGADHDLAPARPDRHARTVDFPPRQGAQGAIAARGWNADGSPRTATRGRGMNAVAFALEPAGAQAQPALARTSPLLRVDHLTMRFGGLLAVSDLSFTARRGDITALIGPNGAGKTTVFNCITGFYKPTEGRIALQTGDPLVWEELEHLTDRGTRSIVSRAGALFLLERMPDYLVVQKARVARTFQNIRLFPGMTVLENLLVAQ